MCPSAPTSNVRTSETDPLRIATVEAGSQGGLVGITFCPGKCGSSSFSRPWQRDLGADLDRVAAWSPRAVVTLIEDREFTLLKVPDLGERIRARGIEWFHLPIVDAGVPDERFETGWRDAGPMLSRWVGEGERVLVHCRGGLGRAGMVAARLLIELGSSAPEAVRRVRVSRPGAIETAAQLAHVLASTAIGAVRR